MKLTDLRLEEKITPEISGGVYAVRCNDYLII